MGYKYRGINFGLARIAGNLSTFIYAQIKETFTIFYLFIAFYLTLKCAYYKAEECGKKDGKGVVLLRQIYAVISCSGIVDVVHKVNFAFH